MGNHDHPEPSADTGFVPMSDSDFGKLDEAGRTAILKEQHDLMWARHKQLVDGQRSMHHRLDAHGKSIVANVKATQDLRGAVSRLDASMIDNTKLTALAVTGIADLSKNTLDLVTGYNRVKTTATTLEWLTKVAVRFAVPGGLIYGGYKAFTAWLPTALHAMGFK